MSDLYEYIGRRVKINYTDKDAYRRQEVVGLYGTIQKISSGSFGVLIDDKWNKASMYGLYWFEKSCVKILKNENESEDNAMEGFNNVAIVNLLEDYNKKDYAFALYDEDLDLITNIYDKDALVIVNPKNKSNRKLAIVKDIIPIELYKGTNVTAEVVGIVNMKNYIAREEEKVRLEELAKKRAAIEAELEKEINKRKSVEYYEEMAKKYADNPRLAELVGELRSLGA